MGVFEHFALILADTAEDRATAAGTGAGGLVGDDLARQVRGELRAAFAGARPAARGGVVVGRVVQLGVGHAGAGVFLGLLLFELSRL